MTEPNSAKKQQRKIVNALLDCLVNFKFWFEVSAYILGAITVVLGGLTLLASREDGRRQEKTILGLQQGIIDSSRELEAERMKRAELVESVLWRNGSVHLSDWWREKHEESTAKARSFGDFAFVPTTPAVKVSIVCIKEREPMWVAHMLGAFMGYGVELTDVSFADKLRDGITVECRSGPDDEDDFRYEAQNAIIEGLRQNFVSASKQPADLPDNTLRILIGRSDRFVGPQVVTTYKDGKMVAQQELPPPMRVRRDGKFVEIAFPEPTKTPNIADRTDE